MGRLLENKTSPFEPFGAFDRQLKGIREKAIGGDVESKRVELAMRMLRFHRYAAELFGYRNSLTPSLMMLLDLYVTEALGRRHTISNICEASGCPAATALRWLGVLQARGFLRRHVNESDRRSAWLSLTECGRLAMHKLLDDWAEHGADGA